MRPSPGRADARLIGVLVALVIFFGYWLTFSSIPTSDGYSFIRAIDGANYGLILFPNALFSTSLFYLLRRLLTGLGWATPTLAVIQAANALSAALGGFLLYRILLLLGGGPFWGVLGAGLLASSYGFWYFANGEMHHIAMAFLLLIFYLVLKRRVTGAPLGWPFLAGVALLNVTAGFFHQEHFLFGLTAVALVMVGRPWRPGLRDATIYTGAGIFGSVVVLFVMGRFVLGLGSLDEIRRWYFWQLDYAAREYVPEHPLVIGARLVKGQLTAWLFGTQTLADAVRRPELVGYARVVVLSGLTLLAYGTAGFLLWQLWTRRRLLGDRLRSPLVAACVWLSSYPVLLAWYFPAVTEYYLKTLPPLILLLLLGGIAAERQALARVLSVLLLVLVLVVNFWGAIWPWYRYGQIKEGMVRDFDTRFRSDDLFISFESGLDHVFRGRARFLPLKGRFDKQGKQKGFEIVWEAIATQLDQGGRVFAYNLVPAPFSLKTLNDHLRDPKAEPYRAEEFEAFVEKLRQRYVLHEVLRYWEEAKEPLYLFGERLQPLWEVKRKTPYAA